MQEGRGSKESRRGETVEKMIDRLIETTVILLLVPLRREDVPLRTEPEEGAGDRSRARQSAPRLCTVTPAEGTVLNWIEDDEVD